MQSKAAIDDIFPPTRTAPTEFLGVFAPSCISESIVLGGCPPPKRECSIPISLEEEPRRDIFVVVPYLPKARIQGRAAFILAEVPAPHPQPVQGLLLLTQQPGALLFFLFCSPGCRTARRLVRDASAERSQGVVLLLPLLRARARLSCRTCSNASSAVAARDSARAARPSFRFNASQTAGSSRRFVSFDFLSDVRSLNVSRRARHAVMQPAQKLPRF